MARTLNVSNSAKVRTEVLPRAMESAPLARRLVRGAVEAWELQELAPDAEVVTAELVANAVQHARAAAMRVTVRRTGERAVQIAVFDRSRVLPFLKSPAPEEVGGRGLGIVDALAQSWGVDRLPWGKRVWADLVALSAP
ncbi:ATP-binding protein [Streptomyces sp. NPDC001852]|uniref:ATP-binding protein n=1 Tax=Streptomyces sp. NPDC001852 TaxID=3364619 RepID=UPI003679CD53